MNGEEKFWRKAEFCLVALFFVCVLIVVVGALEFPSKARLFPMLVGLVSLVLITADILQMLIPRFGAQFKSLRGGEWLQTGKLAEDEDALTEEDETAPATSVLKTALWFICAFPAYYLLGYLLFSIAFIFLFLKFYAFLSLRKSSAITAGSTAFLWIVFSVFLKMDIFAGSSLF